MSDAAPNELHLLLDAAGSIVVYQEKDTSWAGVLAFSSEAKALEFVRASNLDVSELATISSSDPQSNAALINSVKKRAVRNIILDLDYRTGRCAMVDFEGEALGPMREFVFAPKAKK